MDNNKMMQLLAAMNPELAPVLALLVNDVQEEAPKRKPSAYNRRYAAAYKRIKNFACVEVHPQSNTVLVYLKVDPDSIDLAYLGSDLARDVRNKGHWGTGDLELRLGKSEDLEKAKPLIVKSYEVS